jgi:hypothetical protein
MAVQARDDARVTLPLFAAYLVFGTFWGAWVVVFAEFLDARALSEGEVGLWLAIVAVASIATMTLLSPRLQTLPLSATIALGHLCMGAGALLIAWIPAGGLALAFVVLGVGNGLLDVFVNVGAQSVEVARGRPTLQYVAACYNFGGIVGAIGAGLALNAGTSYEAVMTVVGLTFGAAAIGSMFARRLAALHTPVAAGSKISVSVFLRSPMLILPAIVVLSSFLLEGSMDIWSVIYLRETLTASVMAGALAFAAFSLAMAIGRLTAGRVLFGMGYRKTLLVSGSGALASGLVAAFTTSTVVAGGAFLFLGFFIASAAPAAFGIVSESDEDPALAIAGMVTVGYSGFIVGPPLMGWLAQTTGLRATMAVLVSSSLGVIAGGLAGRRDIRRPPPAAAPSE